MSTFNMYNLHVVSTLFRRRCNVPSTDLTLEFREREREEMRGLGWEGGEGGVGVIG